MGESHDPATPLEVEVLANERFAAVGGTLLAASARAGSAGRRPLRYPRPRPWLRRRPARRVRRGRRRQRPDVGRVPPTLAAFGRPALSVWVMRRWRCRQLPAADPAPRRRRNLAHAAAPTPTIHHGLPLGSEEPDCHRRPKSAPSLLYQLARLPLARLSDATTTSKGGCARGTELQQANRWASSSKRSSRRQVTPVRQ